MTSAYIDFAGYHDCVKLENATTRVVLGPHLGGRVLEYAWRGENALYLDPRQDGLIYKPDNKERISPSAGRCDIGPEHILPAHPALWLGAWTAEIVDSDRARMTSVADEVTGVQLVRDFRLAASSTHLWFTQTVRNVSDREVRCCHWSRTFGRGHGICLVPLSRHSRFPRHYIMYGPGPVMNFFPDDPAIRIREGFLEMIDTPAQPKLGLDSVEGWFAYLEPNNLMLIKRFPTYPGRVYGEMASLTISLWYFRDHVCELEPIGSLELLQPGESSSFTEEWWLTPFSFPPQRDKLEIALAADVARELMEN